MKQRGFTLAELMGVISILAILSLLLSIPVTKLIRDANKKACNDQIETIIAAAKLWGSEQIDLLPEEINDTYTLTIKDLMNAGYLEEDLMNPKTKEAVDPNLQIVVTKKGKNYFEYKISTDICS